MTRRSNTKMWKWLQTRCNWRRQWEGPAAVRAQGTKKIDVSRNFDMAWWSCLLRQLEMVRGAINMRVKRLMSRRKSRRSHSTLADTWGNLALLRVCTFRTTGCIFRLVCYEPSLHEMTHAWPVDSQVINNFDQRAVHGCLKSWLLQKQDAGRAERTATCAAVSQADHIGSTWSSRTKG